MGYFNKLIDRSYDYYTEDKDVEIAKYFFETQDESKYIKLDFYSKLISAIDSLINEINLKAINLMPFLPSGTGETGLLPILFTFLQTSPIPLTVRPGIGKPAGASVH